MAINKTPLQEIMDLRDRMNRLFESRLERDRTQPEDPEGAAWVPPVDIYETRDELVVKVEVPGVSRDHFSIEIKGDDLIVKGERPFEKDVAKENVFRLERPYGKFFRHFLLGIPVQADKVRASYQDGVLEVCLPKSEVARSRKIQVEG